MTAPKLARARTGANLGHLPCLSARLPDLGSPWFASVCHLPVRDVFGNSGEVSAWEAPDRDCECGHALEDHRSRSSNCEAPGCECELYEPEHIRDGAKR